MNAGAELPEHARRNRVHWNAPAVEYAGPGEIAWARNEPTWGIWGVPDSKSSFLAPSLTQPLSERGCIRAVSRGARFQINSFFLFGVVQIFQRLEIISGRGHRTL